MARGHRGIGIAAGVIVVALLAAGVWVLRGGLGWGAPAEPVEVSEEAAEIAAEKLERLREEDEPVSLSAVELSSLMRYRAPAWAAGTLHEPGVHMRGDTLVFTGTVATAQLPSHPELDQVRGFLPDSAGVEVAGRLRPLEGGRTALEIDAVELAGLPVPARFYGQVLSRAGRRDEPGLAANAIALPLPPGARSARVADGRLVLTP